MLRFNSVSKYFGEQLLFAGVNWQLDAGQKVGVVGVNGCGKSTLLKLCDRQLEPDSGTVIAAAGCRSLMLPQMDYGLDALSGGQKQRRALAQVLSRPANLLLLDEPTNNLDEKGILWLEAAIRAHRGAFLIVSHDGAFLDALVDGIVEVDAERRRFNVYGGNYSLFERQVAEQKARQLRQWQVQERSARRLSESIDALKKKAMATEQSTQVDFYRGISKRMAASAKARQSRLHRMLDDSRRIDKPAVEQSLRLQLEGTPAGNRCLIELRDVVLGYEPEQPLLSGVNLAVYSCERIAVCGDNGAGKSLLLRALVGQCALLSGHIYRCGRLTSGYLSQQISLPAGRTVLSFLQEQLPESDRRRFDQGVLRTFLHRFLFEGDHVFKPLAALSGGELMRLQLAAFMVKRAELLVLDEPTNHLDPRSIAAVESALAQFQGTLIVVSHHRRLRANLQLSRQWQVADGLVTARSL